MKSMLLLAAPALAAAHDKIWVDNKERVLRDAQGRHTIFHGVNVVYKVAPYIPITDHFDSQDSLSDQDIDNMVKWGMNHVRLGVMWEAVERSRGVYDQDYLKKIDELITRLGEKGIYTLVDAHQDVLTRMICGEGMPEFYAKEVVDAGTYCVDKHLDIFLKPLLQKGGFCKPIKDYNYKTDSNGDPLISECQSTAFFNYYSSPESLTLFRAFYHNDHGLADKYVAYWAEVANSLSSNKWVMGFDPFNEPLPAWTSLANLIHTVMPGNFDKDDLAPLYARINGKLQSASKDNIMYFEPGQVPDALPIGKGGVVFPVGFEVPPGGQIGSTNHVLNDHTYCCTLDPAVC